MGTAVVATDGRPSQQHGQPGKLPTPTPDVGPPPLPTHPHRRARDDEGDTDHATGTLGDDIEHIPAPAAPTAIPVLLDTVRSYRKNYLESMIAVRTARREQEEAIRQVQQKTLATEQCDHQRRQAERSYLLVLSKAVDDGDIPVGDLV